MRCLVASALLALLSACAGSEGAECELDDECAETLTCFANICQDLGTPDGAITFEVVPQPATGLQAATFAMGVQPLRFGFCQPAAIAGTVEGAAEIALRGEPAGLTGETRRWRQRVEGDFRLPLPPGTWRLDVSLDPAAGALPPPPEQLLVQLARCATVDVGTILPPVELHRARFGVVVDPIRDPRPRCGVLASIHDPLTGEALSQPLSIEKEPGLGCDMSVEGWELPFRPPTGDEIELRLVSADGNRPTLAELRFSAPDAAAVDFGLVGIGAEAALERVRIEVRSPEGTQVEGASVRAIGQTPDGGLFAPPRAADLGGGHYELWLLPGSYEVYVEPPHGLRAATGRCLAPAEGGACAPVLVVEPATPTSLLALLPPPLLVSGRVLGVDRVPIAGARVEAVPAGDGRRATTTSGTGGRYELLVDPGAYEFLVQAPGVDVAWARIAPGAPLLVDERRDLQLPPPARVVGTVLATRDEREVPLHRALVRAWSVGETSGPKVVGETLTDTQGRFNFVLPAAP